jgi:pimeloyl-ACP methyl ester carboxylesterase
VLAPRLLAALVLAAVCALVPASAASGAKAPSGLAFYRPPKKLTGEHGDVIWARKLSPGASITAAAKSYLVLYRSTSVTGKPIAVSGTLAIPKGKPPKGGWPVVSWAHGTSGAADVCAPTRSAAPVERGVNDWLKAGYAIASTDYEGLGTPGPHPYLIGVSAGRSVTDIVTAAGQLDRSIGRRWVAAGISQGGHAALWAAAIGQKWAPKLTLLGVDAYAPGSHIHEEVEAARSLTTPSPLSVIGALLIGGAVAASPTTIKPADALSPAALALLPDVEKRCNAGLGEADSWGGIAPASILRDGYDRSALYKLIDANDPRRLRIKVPVFMQQGTADGLVFPAFTDEVVASLKKNGATVDYRKYDGADHDGVFPAGRPDSVSWLKKTFK